MVRIKPYTAMAYQNNCWQIEKTSDMKRNVENVVYFLKTAANSFIGNMEFPLRLVALSEGFCTGWPEEFLDVSHVEAMKRFYDTTIPGEETDMLGEAAKACKCYIMGTIQARDPELMDDRFFNTSFILDPRGKVIYKMHKTSLFFGERATCPSDIWDRYIEKYGTDPKKLLDALFPVVKTEIGNLGCAFCGEGDKPEPFRALALNGAEIIYRSAYVTDYMREQWEIQNRANANFNTCYIMAPSAPNLIWAPAKEWRDGIDHYAPAGEGTHIVDYRGIIVARTYGGGMRGCTATIDIEQLRHYRCETLYQNFLAQLRIEEYVPAYLYALRLGLYPKNMAMDEPPLGIKDNNHVIRYCINRAVENGLWVPPDGWTPHKIPKQILDLIKKAEKRKSKRK